MWTPTHVLVTVTKAKNLYEKGKGGNDAYCIFALGKDKFVTSVKQKTVNPVWDEQAEFALNEKEDLKVTVYHKSPIIDEFIGRAVLNISELALDSNSVHMRWYKLMGKPDKENKKPEKERGEIEVRVEFLVRPKSNGNASTLDLSKTKEKSMSLKSLKDKSLNIKHSIGDKFKSLKRKTPKFAGENQFSLAEQSKRMGGSKLDFLEGEDLSSLTSSYSSINGNSLIRAAELKNQSHKSARSSIISENSGSNYDDLNDTQLKPATTRQFSTRSMNSNINAPIIQTPSIDNRSIRVNSSNENQQQQQQQQPQPQSSSTPQIQPRSILKTDKKEKEQTLPKLLTKQNSIQESTQTQSQLPPPPSTTTTNLKSSDSFASIFQASLNENLSRRESIKESPIDVIEIKSNKKEIAPKIETPQIPKSTSLLTQLPILPSNSNNQPQQQKQPQQQTQLNTTKQTMKKLDTSFGTGTNNDDDDDIDWASSDEEIVKQEIEIFERTQTLRQSERRKLMPTQDLTSDLNNSDIEHNVIMRNKNNNQSKRDNLQIDIQKQQNNLYKKQSTDSDDDIKTPDIDMDFVFQEHAQNLKRNVDSFRESKGQTNTNRNDLPDILIQKGNSKGKTSDKAKKFIEGLDGVSFNDITIPESLRKQLEFFDREELLRLIAYQKKYLDYKESRIKDLDNYIDNLVVRVIETNPALLMQAGTKLQTRNKI